MKSITRNILEMRSVQIRNQVMISRKEQQAELLIQFGELVSPLEELVEYPDTQTANTRIKATAKFTHDRDNFQHLLNAFTHGEPGHDYKAENTQISGHLNRFTNQILSFRESTENLRKELQDLKNTFIQNILAIPCELDTEVLEAGSPFTAFMKIRSIFETATKQLVLIDPYMGQGTVRRYFHNIPEHVTLAVVTKKRSGDEFRDFLDVSRLYAKERSPSHYSLMYHPDLHDRYLKCDNTIYHLGGSLKDAGSNSDYTVSKIQDESDGEAKIRNLIADSTEQFGPKQLNHP